MATLEVATLKLTIGQMTRLTSQMTLLMPQLIARMTLHVHRFHQICPNLLEGIEGPKLNAPLPHPSSWTLLPTRSSVAPTNLLSLALVRQSCPFSCAYV